jgi:uncharacterized lipoprotein
MNTVIRFFILALPIALIGCSHLSTPTIIKNRDKHYLAARSVPPMRIPPGLSSEAMHNQYPVSDRQYPVSAEDVSLVPPGLNMH